MRYPMDPSAEGHLFLQMRGAFAEYERKKFEERTRSGKLGRAQAGVPSWGNIPYGYRYISQGKHQAVWEVASEEASVICEMYSWLHNERLSIRGITKRLNQRGIKPKKGKGWGKTAVYRALTYEGYTGVAYWNKTMKAEPKERRTLNPVQKKDKAVKRDSSEWIKLKVPQIIEPDVFEAAQRRLDGNRYQSAPKNSREYLLTGHLFCMCGRHMSGCAYHGRRFYRCTGKDRTLVEPSTRGILNADAAECLVWSKMMEILENPELITQHLNKQVETRQKDKERHSFELDVSPNPPKDEPWGQPLKNANRVLL